MGDRAGSFGSSGRAQPTVLGQTDTMFKFVDLSLAPSKNDRAAKLGNNLQSYGAAVCDVDPATLRVSLADGMLAPGTNRSLAVPEPDNWAVRVHDAGRDRVWAVRLIADHTNKHNQKKNRSTMVIDQQERQRWSHLSEVFWVKDVGVSLDDKDLKFNGAGILDGLCPSGRRSIRQLGQRGLGGGTQLPQFGLATPTGGQGDPEKRRYHTCFNINHEAGFVTNGKRIGQFRRVIVLDPWTKVGVNADGEQFAHAALPSDVVFSANPTQWGPMAFDCGGFPETPGDVLVGYHWWHRPTGQCRQNDDPKDDSEDGRQLSPALHPKEIWVFVRKHAEWVPTGDGGKAPDPPPPPVLGFPGPLGAGLSAGPGAGAAGAFHASTYPAGVQTAESNIVPLPEAIPSGWNINVEFEFVTPLGGIGGVPMSLLFDWCVIPKGGSAAPGAPTGSTPRAIDSVTHPGSEILYRLVFKIPYADIKAAAGGKVVWAFGRLVDGNANQFHVVGRSFTFSKVTQPE